MARLKTAGLLLIGMLLPAGQPLAAERQVPGLVECDEVQELGLPKPGSSVEGGLSEALQATYERTCKMCHDNPGTGAPRSGDPEAWAPRLAQGRERLLDHTMNGYRTMPPFGLCMACNEEQFIQLIEYMAGERLQ